MRLIDEQYTQTLFYGSPKMTAWQLSNPPAAGLDTHFCPEASEVAFPISQPENFNTHQMIQFTSLGIFVSAMDGQGDR